MRKLDIFPCTYMGGGDYVYVLADDLTKQEKLLVAISNSSRLQLFEQVFPDLWIWCRFSLDPHEWRVDWDVGHINKENWTFDLWLRESAHVKFQLAWAGCDEAS